MNFQRLLLQAYFFKTNLFTPFKAIITANGKLTPNYEYISQLRAKRNMRSQIASSSKKVLILGAGFVSEPVVEYLSRDPNTQVTVCSALKKEVDKLAAKYTQIVPAMLDVTRSKEELEKLLKNHQVVISLLPFSFHPSVAELCIKYKVNMVTASYLTKPMQMMHDQ
jgi:alpha-aminoadipic semialdehyde synthase